MCWKHTSCIRLQGCEVPRSVVHKCQMPLHKSKNILNVGSTLKEKKNHTKKLIYHHNLKSLNFVPAWWENVNTSCHFEKCSALFDWVGWRTSFTACKPGHSCSLWSLLKAAKRATANASQSSCQQAYSTQHKTQRHDFLLQPHWTLRRLHAAFLDPANLPSTLILPLILNCVFTPHKKLFC